MSCHRTHDKSARPSIFAPVCSSSLHCGIHIMDDQKWRRWIALYNNWTAQYCALIFQIGATNNGDKYVGAHPSLLTRHISSLFCQIMMTKAVIGLTRRLSACGLWWFLFDTKFTPILTDGNQQTRNQNNVSTELEDRLINPIWFLVSGIVALFWLNWTVFIWFNLLVPKSKFKRYIFQLCSQYMVIISQEISQLVLAPCVDRCLPNPPIYCGLAIREINTRQNLSRTHLFFVS